MPTFWDDAEGFDIWYVERTLDGLKLMKRSINVAQNK